jgi:hypothetical protein
MRAYRSALAIASFHNFYSATWYSEPVLGRFFVFITHGSLLKWKMHPAGNDGSNQTAKYFPDGMSPFNRPY